MDIITTTDLRSKTPQLVDTLKNGGEVILVHRSKIIGKIKPAKEETIKFNAEKFKKLAVELNLPKLSDREIRKRYSEYLTKRYGKNIS